jgi:hypothetical protein
MRQVLKINNRMGSVTHPPGLQRRWGPISANVLHRTNSVHGRPKTRGLMSGQRIRSYPPIHAMLEAALTYEDKRIRAAFYSLLDSFYRISPSQLLLSGSKNQPDHTLDNIVRPVLPQGTVPPALYHSDSSAWNAHLDAV